ncbi:MAG TPA: ABC transporter permease [Candidatus Limnocylindrales bacterium]|jgi:ABC-2 type transport system permease protein
MTSARASLPWLSRALLVPGAFFERDRRIEASYRAGLLLRIASAVVTVGMFFFLGRVFDAAAPALTDVGGSYFAFVVIGIAAQEFLGQSVGTFGGSLRESQTTGTLELMLLGRSRLVTLLVSSTLWLHASAGLGALTYLVLGTILGIDLSRIDLLATVIGVSLMLVGFTGMGLLAGATVLVVKRGNPLGWALRGASVLLGGILYPVSVLPPLLQAAGATLPMTHALVVLRGAMLDGLNVVQLSGSLVALAVTSAAFLAIGLVAFSAAVRHARTDGSLAQY